MRTGKHLFTSESVSEGHPDKVCDRISDSLVKRCMAEEHDIYEPNPLAKRETLEFVRAYYKITDSSVRRRIFDLTKALANASEKED